MKPLLLLTASLALGAGLFTSLKAADIKPLRVLIHNEHIAIASMQPSKTTL